MTRIQKGGAAVVAVTAVLLLALVAYTLARNPGRDEEQRSDVAGRQGQPAPAPATWHTSLPEALADAKTTGRPVLVLVTADWCGWCDKLERETLTDPMVRDRLRDFTLLKIDWDRQHDVAVKFGDDGVPNNVILDSEGGIVAREVGYLAADDYLTLLASAGGRTGHDGTT